MAAEHGPADSSEKISLNGCRTARDPGRFLQRGWHDPHGQVRRAAPARIPNFFNKEPAMAELPAFQLDDDEWQTPLGDFGQLDRPFGQRIARTLRTAPNNGRQIPATVSDRFPSSLFRPFTPSSLSGYVEDEAAGRLDRQSEKAQGTRNFSPVPKLGDFGLAARQDHDYCVKKYVACQNRYGMSMLNNGKRCADCFNMCTLYGYWPSQYCPGI